MKLAAHPLVVAVALGLLDAGALGALDETAPVRTEERVECESADCDVVADTAFVAAEEEALNVLVSEFQSVVG